MVKRIQGCFRCRYFRIRLTSARSSRWPRLQLRQPLLFGPSPHLSDHFPGPLFLCMRTWHSLAIAEPWQVNGQNLKSSVEIKSIHHATGLAKKTVLAFSFLSYGLFTLDYYSGYPANRLPRLPWFRISASVNRA